MTNTRRYSQAVLALVPVAIITLSGCSTPAPVTIAAATGNPGLVGATIVVETQHTTTDVLSVSPAHRQVVLRGPKGTSLTCKAGPQVTNFSELQAGDRVKAVVANEFALFLVKNGPVPNAGAGIAVDEEGKGASPGGIVLETKDITARVKSYDSSYRLLTLEYADGQIKAFKLALHSTIGEVKRGDEVVVRIAEPMAVQLERH